jgi:anaerobic ribonucleoside-triphosphate reductase activating protein|tara:strand:- start:1510 stop:2055 length:546 start_codon:yes stop_codon:yes gene_type:complete
MNIHSIIPNNRVNGPGNRFVIWMQGCSLDCPGCWNPETHSFNSGNDISRNDLLALIKKEKNIEGITISGGEPFEQPIQLYKFTKHIRIHTSLSQIIYSGYTIEEIQKEKIMKSVLSNIDVLIDGRYNSLKSSKSGFIGSTNQNHHFLTNRYSENDFKHQNRLEYHFLKDGTTTLSGFPTGI